MVFRQCFRLGDGNIFIAHFFLVFFWEMETFLSLTFFLFFFSADEEKKHVYALVLRRRVVLFVTAVQCFLNVQFLSSLNISAQLFVTPDVCAICVFDSI